MTSAIVYLHDRLKNAGPNLLSSRVNKIKIKIKREYKLCGGGIDDGGDDVDGGEAGNGDSDSAS